MDVTQHYRLTKDAQDFFPSAGPSVLAVLDAGLPHGKVRVAFVTADAVDYSSAFVCLRGDLEVIS